RYGLEGSFAIRRPIAEKLRSYQDVVYSYGPLLGVFALVGLLGAVVGLPSREGRNLRAEAALFVLAGLGLLLASVMTTVYHYRYVLATAPLLAPAGAIGAAVLLGRLRERRAQEGVAGEGA
ncbi:MAG: hypothetical protein H0U16_07930, partial [Actinobacteria bacterium]|nr:hypothetical protein [Actinomycetota bacterium]